MLHKLWYFYIQLNFECSIFTLWYCKFDLSKSFFQHCQLEKEKIYGVQHKQQQQLEWNL